MLKAIDGNTTVYYTRGFELISRREGAAASYYVYDGGLSVRALTNEAGTVKDTLVTDSFGNETGRTGTTDNPYGFQGEEQDSTGLYYLRARYMDPATGMFTTMDTYGGSLSDPMSLHKYLFANSNPVMYSDPSGQFSLAEMDAAMAIDRILDSAMVSGIIYCVNANATDPEHEHHDIIGYFSAIGLGIIFGAVAIMLSSTVAGLFILAIIDSALGAVGIYNGILDILNGHPIYGVFEIISSILLIWFGWRNYTSARNAGKSSGLIHLEAERKATGEGNWDDINQEINDFYRDNKPATVNCDGLQKPVYRGGNDFTAYPKDIKYNKITGNVKPSQGISVNVDPKSPNVINNGGAYRVETIPNGLDIIQKGKKDPGHFEIVPEFEMSFEEYQGLLNRIIYSGPY